MGETDLRWILLIIGILILAALYTIGYKQHMRRRRRREQQDAEPGETIDVSFNTRAEDEDLVPETEPFDEFENILLEEVQTRVVSKKTPAPPAPKSKPKVKSIEIKAVERPSPVPKSKPKVKSVEIKAADRPSTADDKIISLYVVARPLMALRGEAILKAAEDVDLDYGEMRIFNRVVERSGRRQIVFRMANAVKPGTFDLDNLWNLTTPGLVLFMQLPGPLEGLKAFNSMLDCAKKLAVELNAELRDETRSVLSNQTIDHMREEIQLYSLRTTRTRDRRL
jgi:cell division protein ZipA